jgi:hypothetical protein
MNEEYIKLIQERVIGLLKGKNNKSLFALAKDNCSELSRLTGVWILQDYPGADVFILKGEDINKNDGKSHDVLAIKDQDKYYVIDPTIWQFFKDCKNILVDMTDSIEKVFHKLELKYGGNWKISEKMKPTSEEQIDEWTKIIKENIENI